MGNKLSCANCNGKPATSNTTNTTLSTNARHYPHYHSGTNTMGNTISGGGVGGGSGGGQHMIAGGKPTFLRLWAEVFHVSASSGAVRWNQVSDDLVPITVQFVNGKYRVTAVNSRVDKVLDAVLTVNRLGQASNCFIYWKDSVSGDTWGLNFTSPADARAFREYLTTNPLTNQSGNAPRRAESSYSLRDQGGTGSHQPSKAGSGAHLTTKYYANRTAISTPNSPSKRKIQNDQSIQQSNYTGTALGNQQAQCTCDCMTVEALHKQRNGRIRYANFTRQDSGGTTQSSRSDGSLVRRQHERQQQYHRQNTRSMDEHSRNRIMAHTGGVLTKNMLRPRIQALQALSNPRAYGSHGPSNGYNTHHQTTGKVGMHQGGKQSATNDIGEPRSQSVGEPRNTMNVTAQISTQSQSHLVSTATTTDDLNQETTPALKPRSQRPKSLMAIDSETKCRDRTHRSLEGRRRSLERMQCVDLTDASPPTPARAGTNGNKESEPSAANGSTNAMNGPSAEQLDEYERELRRRLLRGGDSSTNDALETFETLLKESMDDVATLMRDVQQELTLIRAEERRFQSQSTQSLHRLSSAGMGAPTHRSPVFDTLSIDGQLPFLPSFASSLVTASSAYHNAYQSWDRLAGYLTSSEVSDDDRASLTTAQSDDEELNLKSSFRQRGSAVNFECFGSVRKSGFLSVKKWLIRKRHTLDLARKRGWKGYWVCLKGTTLLFYSCDSANSIGCQPSAGSGSNNNSSADVSQRTGGNQSSSTTELTPKHLIFVESCLVQAVPEHPRRDNVFCLSTSFGDAYLFDATSLPERDHWISVIQTACAAQISRESCRSRIIQYINEEYQRLERLVELDLESRQEADLMLSCCTEEKQKQQLVSHVLLLDEKIEKNRIEVFRLKSYLSSLNYEEGPNPKSLLSQASRRSKSQLNRIGVFTVSSLHAFNCARNPQPLEKLHKRDSFSADYIRDLYSPSQAEVPAFASNTRVTVQIILLSGEQRALEVPVNWTTEQVMIDLFGAGTEAREYFLRCSDTHVVLHRSDLVKNFHNHILMVTPKILFTVELIRESNEILFGFSVDADMSHGNDLRVFVIRVEPNTIADLNGLNRDDEIMVINGALVQELDMMFIESVLQEELTLCLMIRSSRMDVPNTGQMLTKSESAHQIGTGASFENEKTSSVTDEFIESLVCPPPPSSDFSQLILSETQLSKYIVPKVDNFLPLNIKPGSNISNVGLIFDDPNVNAQIPLDNIPLDNQYQTLLDDQQQHQQQQQQGLHTKAELSSVDLNNPPSSSSSSLLYQTFAQEMRPNAATAAAVGSVMGKQSNNQLNSNTNVNVSAINHMQKLIRELLDTENTYCQSLDQLVKLYLQPLSQSDFLTVTDCKVLCGSILQIIDAQNEFRSELTEVGEHILSECQLLLERCGKSLNQSHEPNVNELGVGYIADCFLKHCGNFRNYSTFGASHARAVKLMADEKTALHDWLQKRSSGQISQSLESYLVRPIQRVLKYPLLLDQMRTLCTPGTTNYNKLDEAVKEMEKVGEHINEMQRVHDEYGAIFEHLARNHSRTSTQLTNNGSSGMITNCLIDLSPTALIHHGVVDWTNSMEFLGKNCRKGVELHSLCFVFRQFVVFLCKETIRQRKRMPAAKSADVEIIRHQVLIPVIEVQVRANPQIDNETDFKWDLIQLKMNAGKRSEKIYRLSNKTNELRNVFLRTIRQIIREDVRQMNIFGLGGPSSSSGGGSNVSTKGQPTNSSTSTGSGSSKARKMMITNIGDKQSSSRQTGGNRNRKPQPMPSTGSCSTLHENCPRSGKGAEAHKVPCGLCGKEVTLGHRQKEMIAANWKRQDSGSTSSR